MIFYIIIYIIYAKTHNNPKRWRLDTAKILEKYGSQLHEKLSKDRSFPQMTMSDMLADISLPNPKHNKKYLEWMVRSYIDDGIRLYEDIKSRLHSVVEDYALLLDKKKLDA